MSASDRIERLARFVETAGRAKASTDPDVLKTFIEDFVIAIEACSPSVETERAYALLLELKLRRVELVALRDKTAIDRRVEAIEAWVTACRECDGRELLVADDSSLEITGTGWRPITMAVIVCRACGDLRMRATAPDKLPRAVAATDGGFTTVFAPASTRGPFR